MRINYVPILRFILAFFPATIICIVLDALEIKNMNEKMYEFFYAFEMIVFLCFFGGITYLVYAMIHNVMVEARKE